MSLSGFDWPAREGIRIYLPTLRHFACVLKLLVLVLALVLPVALSANEVVTEKVDPDRVEPSQEQKEEARQEIASEIAEGTQTAVSLESLLLGRNYVFFGRIEVEAAAYNGDIPSSENGFDLRRLRVGIAGLATFFDSVSYKFELDLGAGLGVRTYRVLLLAEDAEVLESMRDKRYYSALASEATAGKTGGTGGYIAGGLRAFVISDSGASIAATARMAKVSVNSDLTDTGLSEVSVPNIGFGIEDGREQGE
jgi:hypothetical protein